MLRAARPCHAPGSDSEKEGAMGLDGPSFYDDARSSRRTCGTAARDETPNDTLEKPDLLDLIGSAAGLRVLDLGCGDAEIGRELLAAGSHRTSASSHRRTCSRRARETLAGTGGQVVAGDHRGLGVPAGRVRPGDLAAGAALRRRRRGDVSAGFPGARRRVDGSSSRSSTRSSPAAIEAGQRARSARTGSWTSTTSPAAG